MNKQNVDYEKKIIIVLGIIVVLVFGLFFAIKAFTSGQNGTDAQAASIGISANPSKIEVELQGQSFQLTGSNGNWICTGNENLSLSYSKVIFTVEALKDMTPKRTLGADSGLLTEFGFDEPTAVIKAYVDNQMTEYQVGAYNSTLGEYYVKVSGSDEVYLVSSDTAGLIIRSLERYVDKPLIANVDTSQIAEIEIEHDESIGIKKNGESFDMNLDGEKSTLSEYKTLNIYSVLNSASYSCCDIDATAKEKKQYGLDNPVLTFEVKMDSGEVYELKISKTGDGSYYANENEEPVVYQLDESTFETIWERTHPDED